MPLDNAIQHGKEHRKQYHGSKAIDGSCRNGGDCPWCRRSRKAKRTRDDRDAQQEIEQFFLAGFTGGRGLPTADGERRRKTADDGQIAFGQQERWYTDHEGVSVCLESLI